jgi:hypothetical protein
LHIVRDAAEGGDGGARPSPAADLNILPPGLSIHRQIAGGLYLVAVIGLPFVRQSGRVKNLFAK